MPSDQLLEHRKKGSQQLGKNERDFKEEIAGRFDEMRTLARQNGAIYRER